nr:S4 domain-containing protein [Maliibacterium massiliense]
MRLDKYLKVSRIIKRRTIAAQACDAGKVLQNGKAAKASAAVKVGDVLEVTLGQRPMRCEVLMIADNVGKDQAGEMYRILTDD